MLCAYIFDIDGTLADSSQRVHYICPDYDSLSKKILSLDDLDKFTPDWDSFYRESVNDKPIPDMVNLLRRIQDTGAEILFVTGRSEKYRQITQEWLLRYVTFKVDNLFMRTTNDYRQDAVIKKELYMKNIDGRFWVQGVFEDRTQCVKMWRDLGLTCFQVTDGDY